MVQDVWRLALEETLPRSGGDWKWLRIHRTMEWVDIPADTFPPPGFSSVRYYLDGGSQALSYPVAVTRCRQSSGCR